MRRAWVYGIIGLAGLFILSAFAFAIFQPIKVLPRIRLSPGFALTDQNGQRVTNEDLRGKIVVYSFTYTRCQPPCQQIVPAMQQIQLGLGSMQLDEIPVELITISFDPEYDTPAALNRYLQEQQIDPTHWRFATTSASSANTLKTIIGEGFKVYYQPDTQQGFKFDPKFVLVDGWGIIRGEYRYGTPEENVPHVLDHIQVLIEEIHNSKGAAKLAYEAAHLFMCYAP